MDDGRTMPAWAKRAIVGFWVGGLVTYYAVGVIRALGTLLVVLVVSLFVAFALEPAVNAMARRGIRRGIGTAITFLVIAVAASGFSALVGSALATETTYLIDKAPAYIDDIEGWLNDTVGFDVEFESLKDEFLAGGGAQDLAGRFADDVVNAGATVVSLLFHLFTVALFTFYLVAEGPKLRRMVSSRLSERRGRDRDRDLGSGHAQDGRLHVLPHDPGRDLPRWSTGVRSRSSTCHRRSPWPSGWGWCRSSYQRSARTSRGCCRCWSRFSTSPAPGCSC